MSNLLTPNVIEKFEGIIRGKESEEEKQNGSLVYPHCVCADEEVVWWVTPEDLGSILKNDCIS